MNNMINRAITISLIFCGISFTNFVSAESAESDETKIKNLLQGGQQDFCRKGDFYRGIFSIRSFEGKLCKTTLGAALAEKICLPADIDSYSSSQCHKDALKTLKGQDATVILKDELRFVADTIRNQICRALKGMGMGKLCAPNIEVTPTPVEYNSVTR